VESGALKAVGVLFHSASTNRYLYLLRSEGRNPQTWGLPGGKVEPGESLLCAIQRECMEELGHMPGYSKLIPVEQFTSPDGNFVYHTFVCSIPREFIPSLNHEHQGYAWIANDVWPRPMHPGLWNTVNLEAFKKKIAAMSDCMAAID